MQVLTQQLGQFGTLLLLLGVDTLGLLLLIWVDTLGLLIRVDTLGLLLVIRVDTLGAPFVLSHHLFIGGEQLLQRLNKIDS